MKQIIGLIGVAAMLTGCGNLHGIFQTGPHTQGSGKVKSETRKIGSFTGIESRGSADCEITVGPATSLKVSADDNLLPLITTKVENGKLVISTKGSFSTHHPIKVTVTTPDLKAFSTVGSGDSAITGVKGRAFDVAIVGSGEIEAKGSADKLSASISGSGDLNLGGLKARDADATISGSGDIDLFVTGNLNAQVSGSGDIAYAGNPKNVNRSVSGSGDVHSK